VSTALPPAHRQWLDDFDQKAEIWETVDPADIRGRVKYLRDRYPMPDMALARFFLEHIAALSGLVGRYDSQEELERAIRGLITNEGVIASALSRRGRGRPEL
jgi:hypothetical protein